MMSTTPFLGCRISLISKSEIRYEGILYTIDPKESTIALAKVRSFGTEDRPVERQVPPRDEIFEYIIFRAGDIKDLIVDDPPASIAPGLADPAIIQAHSTSTTSAATFPSNTFPVNASNSNGSQGGGHRGSVPPAFQAFTSSAPTHVSGVPVSYNTSNSIGSRSGNSTPTGGSRAKSPHSETTSSQAPNTQSTNANRANRRDPVQQRDQQRNANQQNRRGGGQNFQQNRRGGGSQANYKQQNFGQRQNYGSYNANNYPGAQRQQYAGGYNTGNRRGPMQPRPQRLPQQNRTQTRPPKETIKFEGEFDFDKAQQEFQELEQKLSNLKVADKKEETKELNDEPPNIEPNGGSQSGDAVNDENDPCYDKTKSFFDTISCEAIERSKGNVQRVDWKQERKINAETFGLNSSTFRRQGGFNRGRGFSGGRGQYRNSRGGGGYGQNLRSGSAVGAGDSRRFNGPSRRN